MLTGDDWEDIRERVAEGIDLQPRHAAGLLAAYDTAVRDTSQRRCGACAFWRTRDGGYTGRCDYPSNRAFALYNTPARWSCADFSPREP